jgi:predicted  nucleic acid-binding Zn-ribbon protein
LQNELTLLRRLQDVDLEIEETLDKADHLSASLEEIGELHGALSGSLEAQKEELEATRKLMRAKSVEVDENRQRFNEAKAQAAAAGAR